MKERKVLTYHNLKFLYIKPAVICQGETPPRLALSD